MAASITGNWFDFLISVGNEPVVFIVLCVSILLLAGARGGSIAPGAVSAFSFIGYMGLEMDSTILDYVLYLGLFAVMLYIAMTVNNIQLGDSEPMG